MQDVKTFYLYATNALRTNSATEKNCIWFGSNWDGKSAMRYMLTSTSTSTCRPAEFIAGTFITSV